MEHAEAKFTHVQPVSNHIMWEVTREEFEEMLSHRRNQHNEDEDTRSQNTTSHAIVKTQS